MSNGTFSTSNVFQRNKQPRKTSSINRRQSRFVKNEVIEKEPTECETTHLSVLATILDEEEKPPLPEFSPTQMSTDPFVRYKKEIDNIDKGSLNKPLPGQKPNDVLSMCYNLWIPQLTPSYRTGMNLMYAPMNGKYNQQILRFYRSLNYLGPSTPPLACQTAANVVASVPNDNLKKRTAGNKPRPRSKH